MKRKVFVVLLVVWIAGDLEAKPIHGMVGLPHSRDFYAGYIKAITDNFDQLFATERETRSTNEDEDDAGDAAERKTGDQSKSSSLSSNSGDGLLSNSSLISNDTSSVVADGAGEKKTVVPLPSNQQLVADLRVPPSESAVSSKQTSSASSTQVSAETANSAMVSSDVVKKSSLPAVTGMSFQSKTTEDEARETGSSSMPSPVEQRASISAPSWTSRAQIQGHAPGATSSAGSDNNALVVNTMPGVEVVSSEASASATTEKKSSVPVASENTLSKDGIQETIPDKSAAKNSTVPSPSEENEEQNDGSASLTDEHNASTVPAEFQGSQASSESEASNAMVRQAKGDSQSATESYLPQSSQSEKRSDATEVEKQSVDDEHSGSGDLDRRTIPGAKVPEDNKDDEVEVSEDETSGDPSVEASGEHAQLADSETDASGAHVASAERGASEDVVQANATSDTSGEDNQAASDAEAVGQHESSSNSTGSSKEYDTDSGESASNTNTTETAKTDEMEEAEPKADDQPSEEKRGKSKTLDAQSESNGAINPEMSAPKQSDTEEEESSSPDGSSNVQGKVNSTKDAHLYSETSQSFDKVDGERALLQSSLSQQSPTSATHQYLASFLNPNPASLNTNAEDQSDIIHYREQEGASDITPERKSDVQLESAESAPRRSNIGLSPSDNSESENYDIMADERAQVDSDGVPEYQVSDYHGAPAKRSFAPSYPENPELAPIASVEDDDEGDDAATENDGDVDVDTNSEDDHPDEQTRREFEEEQASARSAISQLEEEEAANPAYPKEVDISDNEVVVENRNGERRHYILEHANIGTPLFQSGLINYKSPGQPYQFGAAPLGLDDLRLYGGYGPQVLSDSDKSGYRRSIADVQMDLPMPSVILPGGDIPMYVHRRGIHRREHRYGDDRGLLGLPIESAYNLGPQVPYPHMDAMDYDRLIPILTGPYIHECGLHLHHLPIIHHTHHPIHVPTIHHVHHNSHHVHTGPQDVYHVHPSGHRVHHVHPDMYQLVSLPHPCAPAYPYLGFYSIED